LEGDAMKSARKTKKLAAVALCAGIVLGSSGSALAGEITGNGKPTPARDNAKSLCAFSGLEDFDLEAPVDPGVTQNWGQIIRVAGPLGGANSVQTPFGEEGCNAHQYPNK
jgi:hypothetical protein